LDKLDGYIQISKKRGDRKEMLPTLLKYLL